MILINKLVAVVNVKGAAAFKPNIGKNDLPRILPRIYPEFENLSCRQRYLNIVLAGFDCFFDRFCFRKIFIRFTCIKYLTVLLVPILLIYYYRKETIGKRVIKCIKSGLLFAFFVILMYLIYLRNIEMIFYVFIQQTKYRESILTLLYVFFNKIDCKEYFSIATRTISLLCIVAYVIYIFKLLFTKEIKFRKIMSDWNVIVLLFIVAYISNLCVWYFVWLFAAVAWQNSRNARIAMYLPLIYEMLISYYFYLGIENASKTYCFSFISILILLIILFAKGEFKIESKKIKKI